MRYGIYNFVVWTKRRWWDLEISKFLFVWYILLIHFNNDVKIELDLFLSVFSICPDRYIYFTCVYKNVVCGEEKNVRLFFDSYSNLNQLFQLSTRLTLKWKWLMRVRIYFNFFNRKEKKITSTKQFLCSAESTHLSFLPFTGHNLSFWFCV